PPASPHEPPACDHHCDRKPCGSQARNRRCAEAARADNKSKRMLTALYSAMAVSDTLRAPVPGPDPELPQRRRLILASRSPRRRLLLEQMGLTFEAAAAGVDDGPLSPGLACTPRQWVAALAYLKAAAAAWSLGAGVAGATVLGADTVCSVDGRLLGQPRDEADAAAMIRAVE